MTQSNFAHQRSNGDQMMFVRKNSARNVMLRRKEALTRKTLIDEQTDVKYGLAMTLRKVW